MKLVIIGSGIAAIRAAEAALLVAPSACVQILSRDRVPPYSKVALTQYASGALEKEAVFLPISLPASSLKLGYSVRRIDVNGRSVLAEGPDGDVTVEYDSLVIATGARPSTRFGMPFWDFEDADGIAGLLTPGQRAAVIGAGFVGIHLVQALAKRGLSVTLFEREDEVLPGRVPQEVSGFIHQRLQSAGIVVRTGQSIAGVSRDGACFTVTTSDKEYAFDYCFDATGALPDISLAEAAGIECSRYGIVVDRLQRTSAASVFAAGDCAAVKWADGSCKSAGLWYAAAEQGRIAGLTAVGMVCEYPAFEPWNTFYLPNSENVVTGVSFGRITANNGDSTIESGSPEKANYHFAVVSGGELKGYFSIGDAAGPGSALLSRFGIPGPGVTIPSAFSVPLLFERSYALPQSTKVLYRR